MDMAALDTIRQMAAGHYLTAALHAAAELGLADHVGEEAVSVAAIAGAVGAKADAVERIVRLLASRGIFRLEDGRVAHTSASHLLATKHPASMRSFARMMGQKVQWRSAEDMLHTIRTGEAVGARVWPDGGLWGWYAANPEEARVFDAAMAAKAGAQVQMILGAYDFSGYRRIVDVGGGNGHLLRGIVGKHPGVSGVLFDLPHVADAARSASDGIDRMEFAGGDFFSDPIPEGDAVILMEVLHDWDDVSCASILQAVRQSCQPETRLLVIEIDFPEGDGPHWPKLLDILMLTLFAAKQRTAAENTALLAANGFSVLREVKAGEVSILEAQAA